MNCNELLDERSQRLYLDESEVAEINPEARDEEKRFMGGGIVEEPSLKRVRYLVRSC